MIARGPAYMYLLTMASTVVIASLVVNGEVFAQQSDNLSPSERATIEMDNQTFREMELKSLELARAESKDGRPPRASDQVIQQVKEDFGRIQVVNGKIMRLYVSGAPPDYKFIARAAAEINKRATRLKMNLALPQAQDSDSPSSGNRSPLIELNELIAKFVTNPVFRNANTIDAAMGSKAKGDLVRIIDLSKRISKSAEVLAKSGGKVN